MGKILSLVIAISTLSCIAGSLDDDRAFIREQDQSTLGAEEAALRDSIKALPGENVDQLQQRREYEVAVWKWFRALKSEHDKDQATIDALNRQMEADKKAGTLTPEKEAGYLAREKELQARESQRRAAIAEFHKQEAEAQKLAIESAERQAILRELRRQTQAIEDIRTTLDIETGTVRY